ncbi:GGDEF domain-containing protein [Deinococcus cellulosilyticus]|uniref:GGDEF domain-containing protein n=1 Tax=Deinococcus cellulosilyticus (strain DSM 18568 / NBRC 106333 / KACC 11606 / 5516J-15) TaxID=1223518 RepID=A0A511NBE8_DEIC1|nr:GGDEF domain-containing protein [Deinococcus cellulosilyticus]GEM49886.1 hypothetical protein DC3_55210 [Deinococcus cellulosilyticus NBRC 106333 = KACC 11606]
MDPHGHTQGDGLLQSFASGLKKHMRISDVCYRLGGDEFAVVLKHLPKTSQRTLRTRMKAVIHRVHQDGFDAAGVSFVMAFFPQEADTPQRLLKLADGRMYAMKKVHHQTVRTSRTSTFRAETPG